MASPSVQDFIDKAQVIGFEEHVRPKVAELFKSMISGTLKVVGNLLPNQRERIKEMFPVPIVIEVPPHPTLQPHPVLAAVRGAVRSIVMQDLGRSNKVSTLFVGASYMEMSSMVLNSWFSFSVYGREAKDIQRTTNPMLSQIGQYIENAGRYFDLPEDANMRMSESEVLSFYSDLHGAGDRIGVRLEDSGRQYARLVYLDSGYNLSWDDYAAHFKTTGASSAIVFGCYPQELLEKECPENEDYRYMEYTDSTGEVYSRITDEKGFCHGYEHKKSKWASLLRSPAYIHKDFNLVAEIVSRVGPYCIFQISRTSAGGTIVRDITVFNKPYVKVLDLARLAGSNRKWSDSIVKGVISPMDYFLVPKAEYEMAHTYLASLDQKTLTASIDGLIISNSNVRKASGGAALIDKTFAKAWMLEEKYHQRLGAAIIVKVKLEQMALSQGMDVAASANASGFWKMIASLASNAALPISVFVDFFRSQNIEDVIVLEHNPVVSQRMILPELRQEQYHNFNIPFRKRKQLIAPVSQEPCELCERFSWLKPESDADEQEWKCPGHDKAFVDHTFRMTTEEVTAFRKDHLTPNDDDPEGVARVKLAAKAKCPKTGFSFTTRVASISGAFGTGKSFQVKKVVQRDDVVIAPFRELMKDYVSDMEGNPINFKTMHRAIGDMEPRRRCYVDEVSSLPYEFLAVSAYLGQFQEVFLVGDWKQTAVMANEGTRIDKRINCDNAHVLRKNFRNTLDTIRWANEKFGYDLLPCSKTVDAPMFEFGESRGGDVFRVSPDRVTVDIDEADNTVRGCQGKTYDDMDVMLSPASMNTFSVACIRLVCMTRTRKPVRLVLTSDADKNEVLALLDRVEHIKQPEKRRPDDTVKVHRARLALDVLKKHLKDNKENMRVLAEHNSNDDVVTPEEEDEIVAARPNVIVPKYVGKLRVVPPVKQKRYEHEYSPLAAIDIMRKIEEPIPVHPDYHSISEENRHWNRRDEILRRLLRRAMIERARKTHLTDNAPGKVSEDNEALEKMETAVCNTLPTISSEAVRSLVKVVEPVKKLTPDAKADELIRRLRKDFGSNTLPTYSVPVSAATGVVDTPDPVYVTSSEIDNLVVKEDPCGWREIATRFVPEKTTRAINRIAAAPVIVAPVSRSAKDSLLSADLFDPHMAAMGERLNRVTRMPGTLFQAKIRGDFRATPTNSRGNFKRMSRVLRLGTGNGLMFDDGHPTQELHTAAARYACPQKAYVLDEAGKRLAHRIARLAFDTCIDKNRLALAWNSMDASTVLNKWCSKAASAGYASAHTVDSEIGSGILRFHPKANTKVKDTALTYEATFKAPQGISATSKEFNSLMGAPCRVVTDVVVKSLKDEFVWNNGITPAEAGSRYTAAALKVPTRENITMDVVEMDSKQNAFTHEINRHFDQLLGVSDDFLDIYYGLYSNYTLLGSMFSANLKWVKPSGAPWTLKGNTFLEFCIQNYIIKGDGPQAVFMQGDDLNRTQANMVVDVDAKSEIQRYCSFEMTMIRSEEASFCGYVYSSGMLVPNIRRKMNKIISAAIRNDKHFYQYQTGLRQWLKDLRSDKNFGDIIDCNMKEADCSREQIEGWLDCIDSVSHASWEQFRAMSHVVEKNIDYLNDAGYLTSVY
nr:replication-associated protein [Monilinia fructicola beny-like virus 1]